VFNPILQDFAHKYVVTNINIMAPWIQWLPY
jgi:hypothetical protein